MKKKITLLPITLGLLFCSVFSTAYSQVKKAKSSTSATRSVSAVQTASDGNQFVVVTITITKDAFKGPGKIEESFSSDLMATSIKTSGASFSSKDGKATFNWNDIGDAREVTVSYSLRPTKSTEENQTITGVFTYSNHPFTIESSSFTIQFTGKAVSTTKANKTTQSTQTSQPSDGTTNTLEDLYYIIFGNYPGGGDDEVAAPPVKSSQATSSTNTTTASAPQPAPKKVETPAPAPVQQQQAPVQPTQTAPATTTTTTTSTTTTTASSSTTAPVAAAPAKTTPAKTTSTSTTTTTGDLVYRIQIAAVGDKSKAGEVLKQYGITDEPYLEAANSTTTRVLIGSYPNLSSAKTRMEALKTKGLTGAYIVPYYKGKRVSMQEAATHTKQ